MRTRTFTLVACCLALAGCQTEPATDIGPNEATLQGTAACPGDGADGSIWYQVRPAGGAFVDATPRRRFECSAQTAEVAIPDTVTGLAPKTAYEYRIAVLFDNGNFSTWDAAGTQEGTAFDGFRTRPEPVVDEVGVGAHAASGVGMPSLAERNRARRSAESFWAKQDKLTGCMRKSTVRWLGIGESIKVPHKDGESKLTMKRKIKGMGVGCNAPDGYDTGPGLMIFNKDIRWTSGDLCAAYKHEMGHLRGFYHADSDRQPIMNSPVPFPMRVC